VPQPAPGPDPTSYRLPAPRPPKQPEKPAEPASSAPQGPPRAAQNVAARLRKRYAHRGDL
ncbi:hypothetical protein AB4Z54_17695, partial [Streptomyces sp. MCAF7]